MSVQRCKEEVDSAEYSEWLAFDQLDPIGGDREDLRMGILAATIARSAHPSADVRPVDFMPDFDGTRTRKRNPLTKRQTVKEMQQRCMLASNLSRPKGKR